MITDINYSYYQPMGLPEKNAGGNHHVCFWCWKMRFPGSLPVTEAYGKNEFTEASWEKTKNHGPSTAPKLINWGSRNYFWEIQWLWLVMAQKVDQQKDHRSEHLHQKTHHPSVNYKCKPNKLKKNSQNSWGWQWCCPKVPPARAATFDLGVFSLYFLGSYQLCAG